MSKIRSKNANFTLGSLAVEDYARTINMNVEQPDIDITAIGDDGPRSLIDNYRHNIDLDGLNDYVAGGPDATFYSLIGDENGAAGDLSPTGATVGTDDPHYTSTYVLTGYSIGISVGNAQTFRAGLRGSEALVRDVTP